MIEGVYMNVYDKKSVNTLRSLAIDMIYNAGSGHPGVSLDAAPIMYTLFKNHINISLEDDKWINRDRFVLSCGHASALLYSTLYLCGLLKLDDIKKFRKINSKTPGHPEYNKTPYIDMTTGPLGQGFGASVGLALAEKYLNALCKKHTNSTKLIDHYTYCLCSDGDLMEGVSYETASFAGTNKLGKLIVLYDSNNISLDGKTDKTFNDNIKMRFESMNWQYILVKNGEDTDQIDKAIKLAKETLDKPSIIEVKTTIGIFSNYEGSNIIHGLNLTEKDVGDIKQRFGFRNVPFIVPKDSADYFKDEFTSRVTPKYAEWYNIFKEISKNKKYIPFMNNLFGDNIKINLSVKELEKLDIDLRTLNGIIMNKISEISYNFVGGSADLSSSCKTYLVSSKDNIEEATGQNIWYGVREHGMAAISNGLALSNLIPFTSTFLAFSDYMRPSMRLACMMNLPLTYIFTHDSIFVGPDGATHQPIEQLSNLRSIPNMTVYRPADRVELLASWESILKNKKPASLVIPRIDNSYDLKGSKEGTKKGGYIIKEEKGRLHGIIIVTGTEVATAVEISDLLEKEKLNIRVISMPSLELFEKSKDEYKKELFPIGVKVIVLEAGSKMGWENFVYNQKYLLTINKFGLSASSDDLKKEVEFDIETLTEKIKKLIR